MKRFVPVLLVTAAILALVPVNGVVLLSLRRTMPGALERGLVVAFGLVLASVLVLAVVRAWGSAPRLAALGVFLLLIVLQLLATEREGALTEAIERIHLVLYGLLAVLSYRALLAVPGCGRAAWPATILSTALVGTLDEQAQWLLASRVGEMYDVLLNVYAGVAGSLLAVALHGAPRGPSSAPGDRLVGAPGRRLVGGLLVGVAIAFGGFFDLAHVGYRVLLEDVGRFDTFVPPGELVARDAERRARWARRPRKDPPYRRFDLEDHWLTEAGWRVNHRNASLGRSDFAQAFYENTILERYFSAFLDLPGAGGAPRHRWQPEERARIAGLLVSQATPGYRSPVLRARIYTRPPRPLLWVMVAAVVVFGLGLVRAGARAGVRAQQPDRVSAAR